MMRPSHLPLLNTVCKVFHPYSVIECGIGLCSTPVLLKHCKKYVGIEHDKEWVKRMDRFISLRNGKVISWWLPGISIKVDLKDLPEKHKKKMVALYKLLTNRESVDLVFIDSFTCARHHALANLWKITDIVVFHDSEDARYLYDEAAKIIDEPYSRYSYRTKGKSDGTNVDPWTDIILMGKPRKLFRQKEFVKILGKFNREQYGNADFDFIKVR